MRWLVCVVLVAIPSFAGSVEECNDAMKECADDCSLQYGASIKLENKKRFDKCYRKCNKAHALCSERETELKNNGLDDGALDKAANELDENGIPVSTSSGRGKPATEVPDENGKPTPSAAEPPPPDRKSLDEDLRDDVPRTNRSSRTAPVQNEKPARASKVEQRPRDDADQKPARATDDAAPTRTAEKPEPVEERPTRAAKPEPVVEERPTRAAKPEPVVEERPTRAAKPEPVAKPAPVEERPAKPAPIEERPTRAAKPEERPASKPAPAAEPTESEGSSFIPKRRLSKDTTEKKVDDEIRD